MTRLPRADFGGTGVCDRDRSRAEDRPLSRNSKSALRIPAQQQRHLRDAHSFLSPRSLPVTSSRGQGQVRGLRVPRALGQGGAQQPSPSPPPTQPTSRTATSHSRTRPPTTTRAPGSSRRRRATSTPPTATITHHPLVHLSSPQRLHPIHLSLSLPHPHSVKIGGSEPSVPFQGGVACGRVSSVHPLSSL